MRRWSCSPWLLLSVALPAQDDALRALVDANLRRLEMTDAGLEGPGAEWLVERGAASRFFLIGESHGNRETCAVATWLGARLREHGYRYYAMETGPCITEHVAGLAGEGGAGAVEQFIKGLPFSMAFLNWQEEVASFAALLELGYESWGLDQEFAGSARFLLGQLVDQAPDDAAKAVAADLLKQAKAGFAEAAMTGDRSKSFMQAARAEDLARLDAAFADAPAATRGVVEELRATHRIYGHYHHKRYFDNNHDRINLMKRHFADRLQGAGADARVLMKFGAAHTGRGYSPFDQLDLGNQAAELAFAAGLDSFHLVVFAPVSIGADGSENNLRAMADYMEPLFVAMGDDPAVFDLRPLRAHCSRRSVKAAAPEMHAAVFRYDAVLLLPAFHRSTELHPMPK